jgi:predicted metal-dependent hydrolase
MTNIKKIKFKDLEISICFKKIKNINLKINHFHEISMSVPIRIKENEIERFLNTKEEWILKTLDRFEKKNLDDFYYLGQKYELKHQHSESRTLTVEIINNNFLIHLHEGIPLKTKQRLLEKHLEEQLKLLVRDFFEKWEKSLGVSKKSLIIKKIPLAKHSQYNLRHFDFLQLHLTGLFTLVSELEIENLCFDI